MAENLLASRFRMICSVLVWALLIRALPSPAVEPLEQFGAKYYDAAKKDGKLVIYGLGPSFLASISEAFNERFPGIQIEAFDESGQQTRERVIAEQKTGRVVGDVIIPGPGTLNELAELGCLEPYQSQQVPSMIPELVSAGPFANPFRASVTSMAINTQLVPAASEPQAWADVLDPKFRGKIASDDPRGASGGGSLAEHLL